MDNKIKDIIAKLTLEEKAALCSGVSSWETTPIKRLGIPSINMADGPHGMRKEVYEASFTNLFDKSYPATCFPPAATVASTWNRDLVYKMGKALANEAKDQEVAVVLGPGINIKRFLYVVEILNIFQKIRILLLSLALLMLMVFKVKMSEPLLSTMQLILKNLDD